VRVCGRLSYLIPPAFAMENFPARTARRDLAIGSGAGILRPSFSSHEILASLAGPLC
jgi:hypothetical protein